MFCCSTAGVVITVTGEVMGSERVAPLAAGDDPDGASTELEAAGELAGAANVIGTSTLGGGSVLAASGKTSSSFSPTTGQLDTEHTQLCDLEASERRSWAG